MKPTINSIIGALLLVAAVESRGQITIPGANGSDGAFNPSTNIVIDLSQAFTGVWDGDNSANAGKGIYDPEKWAVVFKYSAVNIPTNVTVSFANHPSRAPVVWLVSGSVAMDGTVALNGGYGGGYGGIQYYPEPGPGGFRGGRVADPGGRYDHSAGFGIGGGAKENGAGQYVNSYGNSRILPLIGGSGAGGGHIDLNNQWGTGGAGAGAILIASGGLVTVNGMITANGGGGVGQGSGGAIRVLSSAVAGSGILQALGGGNYGGFGRIRLETQSITGTLKAIPETSFANPKNPVVLWPDSTSPRTRIISVAGVNTPSDPRANLNLPGADVNFQSVSAVPILIQTENLPTNTVVYARIVPGQGAAFTVPATYTGGDLIQATWTANAVVPPGFAAIQVRAVGP